MSSDKKIFWGVLLAAGQSSRMNVWKPAVEINGKALIKHSLDLLLTMCEHVIIVGGYNYEVLSAMIKNEQKYNNDVSVIFNGNYTTGMLSSVQQGLSSMPIKLDGVFILPADMPFVKESTVAALIKSFNMNNSNEVFIPTALIENSRQKKGHPIIIRSSCIQLIKNYDTAKTLRDVIKTLKVQLCEVDDKGIIFDIDEQKDLEKAINFKY